MTFKAVLWDWDNTLFDSWDVIHKGWCAVTKHFGLPEHTLAEVQSFAHRSCRDVFPALFGDDSETASNIFYETVHKLQTMILMPGAPEILNALHKAGIIMGVVSNKETQTLQKEIKACGLDHFFQVMIGSGTAPHDKPAPDGIQMALNLMQLHPTETWYIGDTPVDVEASLQAGCTSVVVHRKESCEPREPNHFCETLDDLSHLLQQALQQPSKLSKVGT